MLQFLRKTYLLGLGLASVTRERLEEVVDELVKRGEVAEGDRQKVLDDLLERAKEEQKKLSTSVKEGVQKVVGEMGIPTRKEFSDLVERVAHMEKAAMGTQSKPGSTSSD